MRSACFLLLTPAPSSSLLRILPPPYSSLLQLLPPSYSVSFLLLTPAPSSSLLLLTPAPSPRKSLIGQLEWRTSCNTSLLFHWKRKFQFEYEKHLFWIILVVSRKIIFVSITWMTMHYCTFNREGRLHTKRVTCFKPISNFPELVRLSGKITFGAWRSLLRQPKVTPLRRGAEIQVPILWHCLDYVGKVAIKPRQFSSFSCFFYSMMDPLVLYFRVDRVGCFHFWGWVGGVQCPVRCKRAESGGVAN